MNGQDMIELPIIMAALGICDQYQQDPSSEKPHTSQLDLTSKPSRPGLRKRLNPVYHGTSKRRCSMKPTKLNASVVTDDVKGYYLNKKIILSRVKHLETIYEEPKTLKNGSVSYIGSTKQRRILLNSVTKAKIRKRKAKLKKTLSGCKVKQTRRISMEDFLSRLAGLMSNSSDNKEKVIASIVSPLEPVSQSVNNAL